METENFVVQSTFKYAKDDFKLYSKLNINLSRRSVNISSLLNAAFALICRTSGLVTNLQIKHNLTLPLSLIDKLRTEITYIMRLKFTLIFTTYFFILLEIV